MFKKVLVRSALLLITFLTACSPLRLAGSTPQPLASPGRDWTIKFTQSGGFAGVLLTVEISSNGRLKAEDARSGRSVSQVLPPESLAQLLRLFSSASFATPKPHGGCADCFLYDLDVTSGGKTASFHADDTTLADSGVAELIGFLQGLRDTALKSAP